MWRIEVGMGINPNHADWLRAGMCPCHGANSTTMVAPKEYGNLIITNGGLHRRKTRVRHECDRRTIMGVGDIGVCIELLMIWYRYVAVVVYLPPEGGEALA